MYKSHGRRAVDVVVAIDHNFLFRPHGAVQAVDGLVHVLHQEGVVEVTERRMEELLGLGYGRDAALNKQVAYRGAIGEAAGKLAAYPYLPGGNGGIIPFSRHSDCFL